ncbi:MAG: hypothetical protein J0J06_13610 [Sphingomonas sp.]|uniref:hypothetical protein n=1 Tax=Sphingomonas sp. TaxID=28214 RepID=UPI001AC0A649|nr:hypothetical protein [Sphingomonas sp.]MBN8816470.1 hypothetical protein [Sphingomonas sp.]
MPPPAIARPANKAESRWSASAWFVLRDGRGIAPGLSGGQLGGSQAGLRIAYAIGDARRVAIVGRVATPLKGQGREAAVGIEWRPTALPVRIVAEYRVALDGGASGPAAGIIAGTGPAPVAFGFDLETYARQGLSGDGAPNPMPKARHGSPAASCRSAMPQSISGSAVGAAHSAAPSGSTSARRSASGYPFSARRSAPRSTGGSVWRAARGPDRDPCWSSAAISSLHVLPQIASTR